MAKGYTVTDVNQRRRYTRGGKLALLYDIDILTDKGAAGTLRVPAAEYEKEKVDKLLAEFAAELDMPFEL